MIRNEDQRVRELLAQGYRIEVRNPDSDKFNEKYVAFTIGGAGKKYAVLDEEGFIIAVQG